MERLFLCILCCAPMMMPSTAERLYFLKQENFTWAIARNQCQTCFKDLVTVIPMDTYIIAQNVTSDTWIGLRKYFYSPSNFTDNSTSNRGMPWTRWANGDPLAFQNWYPGWPVFKSPFPKIDCCSCSCTCPAVTTPLTTTFSSRYTAQNVSSFILTPQNLTNMSNVTNENVTGPLPSTNTNVTLQSTTAAPTLPVEAACVRTPMLFPDLPNPDKNYIEDSCVAMLSTGAWIEKNCTDLLPFICYEDRFFGKLSVTHVTASGALLTWLPGPKGISHYRMEVTGGQLVNVSLNLTYNLDGLMAGSFYTVKVFAVKCGRDIDDPQEANFYTIPNKVVNLTVTMQQDTSITLSWQKPYGNVDFYRVDYNVSPINSRTEGVVVNGLIPGSLYNFSVRSGVNDTSQWSDASVILVYTKPGKVSNLMVNDSTSTSLNLQWDKPPGGATGFIVKAVTDKLGTVFNKTVEQTSCQLNGLPPASMITLSVTAQANYSLNGETVTIVNYTAPEPVSNLTLSTTQSSLTATWSWLTSVDSYVSFKALLYLNGQQQQSVTSLSSSWKFDGLKSAANYTVTVYSVSGNLSSPAMSSSKFTLPLTPENVRVILVKKDQIQFQWSPPLNAAATTYNVTLSSSFWGQSWTYNTGQNETNYTFSNLTSGTKYQFEVRTLAGDLQSDPATMKQQTVEDKIQIGLAMMCSSAQPLLCADSTTGDSIFNTLNASINQLLGDNVFWNLGKVTSENAAT